jgi:hypothetical protein
LANHQRRTCLYVHVPAHTGIAHMMKVDNDITTALRDETRWKTRLEALRVTLTMVRNRGNVSQEEWKPFMQRAMREQQVLEIILGLSQNN